MHPDHVGIERLPESLLLCLIADYCFSRTLSGFTSKIIIKQTHLVWIMHRCSFVHFSPFISQRQSVLSAGSEVNNGGTASRESERRTQKVHWQFWNCGASNAADPPGRPDGASCPEPRTSGVCAWEANRWWRTAGDAARRAAWTHTVTWYCRKSRN